MVSRQTTPRAAVVLARDGVQIGLAENGGDPEQEGCVFEVDNIEAAFAELKGKPPEPDAIEIQERNGRRFRSFFLVAPDGLCYMITQPAG